MRLPRTDHMHVGALAGVLCEMSSSEHPSMQAESLDILWETVGNGLSNRGFACTLCLRDIPPTGASM